jgi:hypothetical protein
MLGLEDTCTLVTTQYQMAARVIDEVVERSAVGALHGPDGVGKTFSVRATPATWWRFAAGRPLGEDLIRSDLVRRRELPR